MKIEEVIKEKPYLKSPLELYQRLREFVERTKEDRGRIQRDSDFTLIDLVINNFCSVFQIPSESFSFLRDEIVNSGKDLLNNPRSLWTLSVMSEEATKEEIERMLFLLSKPFFVFLRKDGVQASFFERGKCPICDSDSSLAMITANNEKIMICPLCESSGGFFRIGCPFCFNKDSSKIEILLDEEEVRVELCLECNSYIKSFRESHLTKYEDPFLVDLVSLPLDIYVQRKGYIRRSPNVIGLRVIE